MTTTKSTASDEQARNLYQSLSEVVEMIAMHSRERHALDGALSSAGIRGYAGVPCYIKERSTASEIWYAAAIKRAKAVLAASTYR